MPLRSIDVTVGMAQYHALRLALTRANRLQKRWVSIEHSRAQSARRLAMPYLHRGLDPAPRSNHRVPVLFLHGFGADKESWLMMSLAMGRRRPIVVPDLPGFGQATAIPATLASFAAQAESALRFIDKLGLQKVDVIGNSMGGGIALRLAHDAPERVRSLVLLNAAGPEVAAKSEFWRVLDRGDNALIPKSEADSDRLLDLIMARRPRMPRAMVRYATSQRVAARTQLEVIFDGWMTSPPEDGLPVHLGGIEVPALIVFGAHDRVIHPDTARVMARQMPRAELHMMSEVGHVPQLEMPYRTGRIVERFLARLG